MRSYTGAVKQAVQFLRDTELFLLPPQGSAGLCSERLEETEQVLALLDQHFQPHLDQLQSKAPMHPYFNPEDVENLQKDVLSKLLVRMSTLKAKGEIQLESYVRYLI